MLKCLDRTGHRLICLYGEGWRPFTINFTAWIRRNKRIINAALKEFARSGYEKASTNEIVQEAGIAKGSLFNYFNNKKELYFFILEYVAKVIERIYAEVDWEEADFFA